MVTSTNQKPRPMSAVDLSLDQDGLRNSQPDIQVRNDVQSRGGNTFAFVILALILLFGGYRRNDWRRRISVSNRRTASACYFLIVTVGLTS